MRPARSTCRPQQAGGAPAAQHPSLGRVHLRDRVPPDVARRRAVRHQLRGVADNEFRPDVEGLRAVAVVVVVLFHLRLSAFQGGFVGVDVFFVLSGFPHHAPAAQRAGVDGNAPPPELLGPARPPAAAGVGARDRRHGARRHVLPLAAGATHARHRCHCGRRVRHQLRVRRPLLGDYFAAQLAEAQPSPLLHYWSLAVEEQFYLLVAAAARPPDPPPAPVPAAAGHHDPGDRRRVARDVDLDDRAAADVGVLPAPRPHGRTARRRRARCCRTCVPHGQRRGPSRTRVVRARSASPWRC